jgi:hypothetical protein
MHVNFFRHIVETFLRHHSALPIAAAVTLVFHPLLYSAKKSSAISLIRSDQYAQTIAFFEVIKVFA